MQSPTLIARRLRTLAEQRFISDAILTSRFNAIGGAVQYQQNESIYTDRPAEGVKPGAEYPMSALGLGPTQIAAVVKWGQDVPITDEAIKRMRMNPVDRAFVKLINQIVKTVDAISLALVASTVTQSTAAAVTWTTAAADQIFLDVMLATANIRALNQGYDPDTVVLDDFAWTRAMAAFVKAGYVPREAQDTPVLTGNFPTIGGMRWLATPNLPTTGQALIVDSTQLGGMADEQLGGPGYVGAMAGVESKSMRQDEQDEWRLRARRVTVPVVIEPASSWKITNL